MKELSYEKVGAISSKYSFLEIYFEDGKEPFMEMSVTDNKEVCFKTYPVTTSIELIVENWVNILSKGRFLKKKRILRTL